MLAYVMVGSANLKRSAKFYDAVMDALGYIRTETEKKRGGEGEEVQASSPTPYQRRSCYPGAPTGRRQGSGTKGETEGRGDGERRGLSTSSQRETSVNMRGRRREGDVGDSSLFHANRMAPQAKHY